MFNPAILGSPVVFCEKVLRSRSNRAADCSVPGRRRISRIPADGRCSCGPPSGGRMPPQSLASLVRRVSQEGKKKSADAAHWNWPGTLRMKCSCGGRRGRNPNRKPVAVVRIHVIVAPRAPSGFAQGGEMDAKFPARKGNSSPQPSQSSRGRGSAGWGESAAFEEPGAGRRPPACRAENQKNASPYSGWGAGIGIRGFSSALVKILSSKKGVGRSYPVRIFHGPGWPATSGRPNKQRNQWKSEARGRGRTVTSP